MLAAGPAARPTLTLLEFFLGAADAALSGLVLLGVLDPADELVAGQRRDVLPGGERVAVGDQRLTQVARKLMNHPTRYSLAAHIATVVDSSGSACRLAA